MSCKCPMDITDADRSISHDASVLKCAHIVTWYPLKVHSFYVNNDSLWLSRRRSWLAVTQSPACFSRSRTKWTTSSSQVLVVLHPFRLRVLGETNLDLLFCRLFCCHTAVFTNMSSITIQSKISMFEPLLKIYHGSVLI